MKLPRRSLLRSVALAAGLTAAVFTAPSAFAGVGDANGFRSGMVFTSSNSNEINELLVYGADAEGNFDMRFRMNTGGLGGDGGLGSQGAVTLSGDGRYVFVVNAGSNDVTTFQITAKTIRLVSRIPSGGVHPISVTEHNGFVYVLNDGGDGNVTGFINNRGVLKAIEGGSFGLSQAGGAAPAQVGFSTNGATLVVSEKGTNRLTSWAVNADGLLGAPVITASPGQTPFGFAFNARNRLVVTEAVGGAAGASTVSSYRFGVKTPEAPVLVSAAVPDTQSAACWVSTTPDGAYAFVANTGSSTISSYGIDKGGNIALIQAAAGDTGSGSAPADTAISADGQHFYVRNGRTFTIGAFTIGSNGTLTPLPFATNLITTSYGLAAN